ncbi:hypothetical protein BCR34DRAFT_499162 [Clohesyomyces aquaticus]|uniref:Rhodopsin domain-containing protein n=1 Tax=Clohesyomyces aquaticus TaxID=1231657 RepID=A0A1Y1Y9E2_9PLEO|nr:hypothetical protein BCR34DRAFT_499162 [Clohesyomyces aquaticus]
MRDLSFINALPPAQRAALLNGPAMKAPTGVLSNFEHPPNGNDIGIAVVIFSGIFCSFIVSLRLYSRVLYHKEVVVEDGIILLALGALGAYLFCVCKIMIHPGIFVHLWDIRVRDLPRSLYYLNVGSIVYGNVIMLLKIAILLEWKRIFVPLRLKNGFWWTCNITLVVNVLFYVACTIVEIFGCNPRRKSWEPTVPGTCLNIATVNIVAASINFVSDLIILFLPQKIIWNLQMTNGRKLAIGALFAMGVLACIAAGFRLHSSTRFATSTDVLYSATDMGLWCLAEMVCGFIVICFTALPKLVKHSTWMQKLISTFKSSKSDSTDRPNLSWRDRLSAPTRRRNPPSDGSLFRDTDTETDVAYSLPITNVSVRSEFSVKTEPFDPKKPMTGDPYLKGIR